MQSYVPYICKAIFTSVFIYFVVGAFNSYAVCNPEHFIKDIYRKTRSINLSRISPQLQQSKIEDIIEKSINFDLVSKFVLGKEIKNLSGKQFELFKDAYKKRFCKKYSGFLLGRELEILSFDVKKEGGRRYFVTTKVKTDPTNEVKISYLIVESKNNDGSVCKIIDIIFAGSFSIAFADRQEIKSFLTKSTIEDLITEFNK